MIEQRSDRWFEERLGYLTASVVSDAMDCKKNGEVGAKYKNRLKTVLGERLTGMRAPNFTSQSMQWGIDNEELARSTYEVLTGNTVINAPFVKHPTIAYFGASPDGFVGSDGLIEIKCPDTATHIERLLAHEVPEQYKPQMCAQILCTSRKWVDFVDFDPRIKEPKLQIMIIRYTPTDEELAKVLDSVTKFLDEAFEQQQRLIQLTED